MGDKSKIDGRKAGALKSAAKRIGVPYADYMAALAAGLRWCHGCRRFLIPSAFCSDRTRRDGLAHICTPCRNARGRSRYEPKPAKTHNGPLPAAPRDGDKRQARKRVNHLIGAGKLPRPNDLPCFDCGHVADGTNGRHEYDHHLGYGAANHFDVQAVCTKCHRTRETDRGVYPKV